MLLRVALMSMPSTWRRQTSSEPPAGIKTRMQVLPCKTMVLKKRKRVGTKSKSLPMLRVSSRSAKMSALNFPGASCIKR